MSRAPSVRSSVAEPLAVRDLVVRGDDDRTILTVPSLDVPAGTSLGVRGPSGAGKTTLLYALAGLLPKASGRVVWGDVDLLSLPRGRRARFRRERLGFVFQDALLFEELPALANAALAAAFAPRSRRDGLRRRATGHLDAFGIAAGRRTVRSYSGGERQRISLARALAGDPSVLLADEPTASLDAAAKGTLVADLVGVARTGGKTLISVSHDRSLLAAMDATITIEAGEVVEAQDDP
ncbi:ATP-binding cassette domain-containing protein [Acuticoccus sp.]|uniref:ATP-binding cassette domain-containing protein n=1 Tax=Acuticoccus sp. TaxID=1904378 RepID=UPI003B524AC6